MKKQVNKILVCLLLVFSFVLCGLISPNIINSVSAVGNVNEYTNVLNDLLHDSNFNASDYEIDTNDYSLKVIQIAESTNRELFVYVYQPYSPNENLRATSINISKEINENLNYKNYKLTLLNSNGVFYKYKVDNFIVRQTPVRYYDISSIFRAWNINYDESPQYNQTVSEVAFGIGKIFAIENTNNGVNYHCIETETIEITDKFVGYVRYKDNSAPAWLNSSSCDRHFVAFTTDRQMDKLFEADVYFESQFTRETLQYVYDRYYGDIEEQYVYLTDKQIEYVDNDNCLFWGGYSYHWNRIQTVDDFIDSVNIDNVYSNAVFNVSTEYKINAESRQALENKEWVLSFYVSDYSQRTVMAEPPIDITERTAVGNVSILRLKFETDGVVYNLGVVDNKQSGSDSPINTFTRSVELTDSFKLLLMLILLIILLIIIAPLLPAIVSFIIWLLKGLWQIITAPFKSIKHYRDKNKKGGGKK